MSTLFGGQGGDSTGVPILGEEDLFAIFRSGEKPPDRFGIGVEYERLPVSRDTGLAIPFSGRPGTPAIEPFLERLVAERGWVDQRENGRIIALEKNGTRVTLEPGAQVELSGKVHAGLDAVADELIGFMRESDSLAASMGIALLGIGYHPFSDYTDIGWVPKGRYAIMGPYLARRGHLSHGMMKATAGCQINLDYANESDAMEKLRVGMAVSSVVTAMCANSPMSRGQRNGFLSKRSHIWLHTDPDRCGLLPFALNPGARYADYVAYALDVPMMFVVRDGSWLDMTGRTFRGFLEGDTRGLTPLVSDWEMHLTTLFPEVRLKAYVEVRGSDSAPPDVILAQTALWKGLLYDKTARLKALELVGRETFEERKRFHQDVARRGLRATLGKTPALEIAQELVRLASDALSVTESLHLAPMRRIVFDERKTPAESLLARWTGEWERVPARLVAAMSSDLHEISG